MPQSDNKAAMAETHAAHVDQAHEQHHAHHNHNPAAEALANEFDIIRVTQKSPYLEKNFIGTYIAISLGGLSAYGGFVMPATSLALINADIGTRTITQAQERY